MAGAAADSAAARCWAAGCAASGTITGASASFNRTDRYHVDPTASAAYQTHWRDRRSPENRPEFRQRCQVGLNCADSTIGASRSDWRAVFYLTRRGCQ